MSTGYLLDSDTCTAYLRGNRRIVRRFAANAGTMSFPVVALITMRSWMLRTGTTLQFARSYFAMLQVLTRLPVTEAIGHRAAALKPALMRAQAKLLLGDLLIAGTALEHQLTLVTRSVKQFSVVPGLTLVNWALP